MDSAHSPRSLLECPVCEQVRPEVLIASCVAGHRICFTCKRTKRVQACPVGFCPFESPRASSATLAEMRRDFLRDQRRCCHRLPTVATGVARCEFMGTGREVVEHQMVCGYRLVPCPDRHCSERVKASDVMDHIVVKHRDAVFSRESSAPVTWHLSVDRSVDRWDGALNVRNFDGKKFILRFKKVNQHEFFSWVLLVGDKTVAERYEVDITVFGKGIGAWSRCLVHEIDCEEEDIISQRDCFSISIGNVAKSVVSCDAASGKCALRVNYAIKKKK